MPDWCSDVRFWVVALMLMATGSAMAVDNAPPPGQMAQYNAVQTKTILELQPWRQTTQAVTATGLQVRLIDLSPSANAWFLLTLGANGSRDQESFHLENPDQRSQKVVLSDGAGLRLTSSSGNSICALWSNGAAALKAARASRLPYAPLCSGRLYLRNKVSGSRSLMESVTDFLRDNVWAGDKVVQFVKNKFYQDAYAETDRAVTATGTVGGGGPAAAAINPSLGDDTAIATQTDLGLSGAENRWMRLGQWYPVTGVPGVFASAITPSAIDPVILNGPGKAKRLDAIEAAATDYLIAFDLGRYDLGFALGTDHPRLNWSPRPPASMRVRGLPGPDGINSADPLVRVGMITPALAPRVVAAFAGGFKRHHGAFKWGPYAGKNFGSHYGFVEQGVVFSKLWPGLSTLYVLDDGTVGMKTWRREDAALLPHIRFARQNGVALIETDPGTGKGVVGDLVTQWGAGNWSGSKDAELRTLRAGACMLASGGRRFLAYAYFSTATPSAMARVFQAYGCRYAMLLDMNAPELTYLAVYARRGGKVHVEHLTDAMIQFDKKSRGGTVIPRFLGFPDSRDFFYLTQREDSR